MNTILITLSFIGLILGMFGYYLLYKSLKKKEVQINYLLEKETDENEDDELIVVDEDELEEENIEEAEEVLEEEITEELVIQEAIMEEPIMEEPILALPIQEEVLIEEIVEETQTEELIENEEEEKETEHEEYDNKDEENAYCGIVNESLKEVWDNEKDAKYDEIENVSESLKNEVMEEEKETEKEEKLIKEEVEQTVTEDHDDDLMFAFDEDKIKSNKKTKLLKKDGEREVYGLVDFTKPVENKMEFDDEEDDVQIILKQYEPLKYKDETVDEEEEKKKKDLEIIDIKKRLAYLKNVTKNHDPLNDKLE